MGEEQDRGAPAGPTGLSQAEPEEGLGPSGFDPSRVGAEEFDSEYVICPGCGYQQGDCWEWVTDRLANGNCPGCGAFLSFWAEHDVIYRTRLVLPPRDSAGPEHIAQGKQP